MPAISVILDNYNYAQYLGQAIDSVLTQTFQDFELIIVDDGSIDNSCEIIKSYHDTRIISVLKENGGQTSAFNVGMGIATGEIVAFLDSDDYWYPTKLEIVFKAHSSGAKIVQHYLAENGEKTYREIANGVDWSSALCDFGYMYQHSPTSSLSFNYEIIAPFFPLIDEQSMRGYSDGCLLMLAMTKARVTCLCDILGYYRIHGKNLNANNTDSGPKLKDISIRQREYVNKQLAFRNLEKLYYDNCFYIEHLLSYVEFGNTPVAIYGTGNSGKCIENILRKRQIKVWGFANSNGSDDGATPKELFIRRNEYEKIIVASSAQIQIVKLLTNIGFCSNRIITLNI